MRRDSLMVLMMMVLAGLSACQQQEKAKPAGSSQIMEEPMQAPAMATQGKEAPAGGMEKSAAEPAAPAQEQTAAPAKETTAAMPVAVAAGDPEKGAKIAKGKCGACHFLDQDKNKVGPTLKGIYNRAPTIEGVAFAKWDEAALDAWLASPKAVKPKTKMAFKGIPEKEKRDDLIAYLKTL